MAEYRKPKEKDLYAILGVERTADGAQIKKAYRKLAKKYHPDSNKGDSGAEKKFKDISEANAILGDPEKRKIYDEFGYAAFESGMDPKEYAKRMREAKAAGFGGAGGFGGFNGFDGSFRDFGGSGAEGFGSGPFGGGKGGRTGFFRSGDGSYTSFSFEGGDSDYSDLFENLFGGAAGAGRGAGGFRSSGPGAGGAANGSFRRAGAGGSSQGSSYSYYGGGSQPEELDVTTSVKISFAEAVQGCDRTIRLMKDDGSGTQTLRVHIPSGIDDGKSVRLRGKGHMSADGKRRGDLLLKVSVEPSKDFTRKGQDIFTTVYVPFTTAVLGGEAQVLLPNGKKIICKVPPGTDAGKKIRIRGKGIQMEKSSAPAGDLFVTVQVRVPSNLTEAEIKKLREFEKMNRELHSGGASAG
ncbi:MAG: DnaJ domain-containing protein [Lachnospiraceae bacterium]|nr:DnaJ domain-containing protein [Lachnospiraceae bacterium]